jgi:hypothetical protein
MGRVSARVSWSNVDFFVNQGAQSAQDRKKERK